MPKKRIEEVEPFEPEIEIEIADTAELPPVEEEDQPPPPAIPHPIQAFNLLREKSPGLYPEWDGLSDAERVAFFELYARVSEPAVAGNPYVECVKEVLNG